MYFDPISAWLVALLFDGAEVLAEQTRGGTIAEYHKERIAQLNRNLNGSIRRERKKYELAVPEMELERIQLHIRIAKKSFEFQQGNGEIIIDPDNQDYIIALLEACVDKCHEYEKKSSYSAKAVEEYRTKAASYQEVIAKAKLEREKRAKAEAEAKLKQEKEHENTNVMTLFAILAVIIIVIFVIMGH